MSKDHLLLLLSYLTRISVAKLTQYIKGKTSRELLQEYTDISKKFWWSHIWARGYFASTTGNVTDELITEYLDQQDANKRMMVLKSAMSFSHLQLGSNLPGFQPIVVYCAKCVGSIMNNQKMKVSIKNRTKEL